MPLIETRKLTHIYSAGTPFERVAIREIDFAAEKGERIGIIGSTGSGKSTFIQHLNGLLKPTSGSVLFDGADIHAAKALTRQIRYKVGLVFQYPEYQLFETTVFEDIAFGPKNMGLKDADVRERVYEAAGFVRLDEPLLQKSPFELSGGQKRRAAIAGVIAMMPEVLVLDEPTAGLDPRGRDEIIWNIMGYKYAVDATVIIVSHNMEEIARSVDRVILLGDGGIVRDGSPAEVFSEEEPLSRLGLSAPKAAIIAGKLREMGLPIGKGIYTIEQMRDALRELRAGALAAAEPESADFKKAAFASETADEPETADGVREGEANA